MDAVDWISLAGAAGILGAYALLQLGRLGRDDAWFNLLNAVAAAVLTWVAWVEGQPGFVALEGTWTLLSVVGLWRGKRGAAGAAPG